MRPARSLDGWCPYCPHRGYVSYSFTSSIRTCNRCNFTYLFEESDMPICSVCQRGYTSCACHLKAPKVGQVLRVVQKYTGGLTVTTEGPLISKAVGPAGNLGSVTLGSPDGATRGVSIVATGQMIEDATWEIVLPPEPPNKSVWVCPAGDNGKLAIWRRLDHQGHPACWFYPGSINGATWAQVHNTGPGYLLTHAEASDG